MCVMKLISIKWPLVQGWLRGRCKRQMYQGRISNVGVKSQHLSSEPEPLKVRTSMCMKVRACKPLMCHGDLTMSQIEPVSTRLQPYATGFHSPPEHPANKCHGAAPARAMGRFCFLEYAIRVTGQTHSSQVPKSAKECHKSVECHFVLSSLPPLHMFTKYCPRLLEPAYRLSLQCSIALSCNKHYFCPLPCFCQVLEPAAKRRKNKERNELLSIYDDNKECSTCDVQEHHAMLKNTSPPPQAAPSGGV